MTFSGSLFVASRNLLFGVFKENYQTSITERCTFLSKRSGISAKSFESTWGKNKSLKNLYYKLTSSQVICSGFQQDFFHLFAYPPIYRSLFVSYIAHILCICIHICKRYYFPLLLFLRWKAKEKQVLFLDDICYLLALCIRRRQSDVFLLLKCFYSRELDHIRFEAYAPLIQKQSI